MNSSSPLLRIEVSDIIKLMKLPFGISKKFLGIDIGTSVIKVVELSSFAGRIKLENYGQISTSALYQRPFRTFEKSALLLSTEDICRALRAVFEEAKITTKKSFFSIPDFTTFFTSFELPPMTSEELPQAVRAEARKYIPVPLGEVTFDWQLIGKKPLNHQERPKILLVAVPHEIINQYRMIVSFLNLELLSLEAEVFSLMRSLIEKEEKKIIGLIDIGARTTTCSIIEEGILKISHSFDISGDDLTERIQKALEIDYDLAEELKIKHGIVLTPESLEGKNIKEILIPLVELILKEIDRAFKNFYSKEGKEVEKIILAGGTAHLPGLLEYFKNYFKKEVEIGNPFRNILYPSILEEALKEIGPSYAIAVGLALRGFE